MMGRFLQLAVVSALVSLPLAASAGGVVTDLRLPERVLALRGTDIDIQLASASVGGGKGGSSSDNGSNNGSGDEQALRRKLPGVGPDELAQIQAGLITADEAASGCGGASAAMGPAGLLPIAVAALALVRRRR